MKGGMILAKSTDIMKPLAEHCLSLGMTCIAGEDGVVVYSPMGTKMQIYPRSQSSDMTDEIDVPQKARQESYRYGYLVDCRDEQLLCDVLGTVPASIDILFCDNEENLFRPSELDAGKVQL